MAIIPKLVVNKQPRSNFNLTNVVRFSASPMLVIPFRQDEVLPDDTWIWEYVGRVNTDSLLSPCLGSFKCNISTFFVPRRLYHKQLQMQVANSAANFGKPFDLVYHKLVFKGYGESLEIVNDEQTLFDFYNEANPVAPSSLYDFLGFAPGFVNYSDVRKEFDALYMLAYYDIVRNYYVHQQSGYARFITGDHSERNDARVPYGEKYVINDMPLDLLDSFFVECMTDQTLTFGGILDQDTTNFENLLDDRTRNTVFGGLACSTFLPDQFTQFLSLDLVAGMKELTKIDVVKDGEGTDHITVDSLRFANKLQRFWELSILGGNGRWDQSLLAHWGVTIDSATNKPEYLGTHTFWVKFGEVISTSNQRDEDTDSVTGLGDRGGIGYGYGKSRSRKFHFKENGALMHILTIVPEIDYSTGLDRRLTKLQLSDTFYPSLDGIGFQDVTMSQLNALPTESPEFYYPEGSWFPVPGINTPNPWFVQGDINNAQTDPFETAIFKQPAWMEYMTKENRLHGRLATGGDLDYWAIHREFYKNDPVSTNDPGILYKSQYDYSPYGLPYQFNYLFNNTSATAQNFIVEIKTQATVKRQKSKNIRPYL